MLFNSFQFAIFFVALLIVLRVAPWRARVHVLLAASLLFYTLWIPSYLLLLLGTLGVNYLLVLGMMRSQHPRRYVIVSIAFTLSLLAAFKYAVFAIEAVAPVLAQLRMGPIPAPDLLLPLGISFYSFEIISLTIDIYRRRQPCPSFARYVLFVTFFPHLIAGPIMRGYELLPQLAAGGAPDPARTRRGVWLIAAGLVKKAIFADYFLAPFVNDVFAEPGTASGPAQLLAVYSFAFQIYFDFAGYTDMARGLACMLGFELPHNFLEPYLSRSASEFWRRWHISLSRWLRDYLYIPLGGNRGSAVRTALNLMATMLLGGLWHGAGWNFVVWGALHGCLLAVERWFGATRGAETDQLSWRDVPRILFTFHAVCLIWVTFRAPTLSAAVTVWTALFTKTYFVSWPVLPTVVVLVCAGLHVLERSVHGWLSALQALVARNAWWGPAIEGAALGAILMAAVVMSGAGAEFIYFQF
ncbi:MAG TPA: MBOAT family protein [Polyangiales bacterium]|nr:MBOAT family protein [Polyangiales bacterium]